MATQADFDRIGNYARMYNQDQNIDRRTCRRTVPMGVLSLGYSRTGTLSMQKALSILGYENPYHFSSMYDNARDSDMWMSAIDAKFNGKGSFGKAEFDQLLGHCGAVTDMPCHLFAAELIEYYPDAKIVLVERNIDTWYASWSTFLEEAFNPLMYFLAPLDPGFLGRIVAIGYAGVNKQVGGATDLKAAKARSKEEYRKYYAMVRSIAPKERFLDFQLASGWEPLCKFLGKPVPNVPFPRINEKKSMQLVFKEMVKKAVTHIARNVLIGTVAVGVPLYAFYKRYWVS